MASHPGSDQGKGGKSGLSGVQKPPAKRGFAAMNEAQQREIASKGGQAAHQKGTAHEFDTEEARRAGQKGGESRQSAQRENGKNATSPRSGAGSGSEQQSRGGARQGNAKPEDEG